MLSFQRKKYVLRSPKTKKSVFKNMSNLKKILNCIRICKNVYFRSDWMHVGL